MFRRKKSSTDVAQRGPSTNISISGPMRIASQAPHSPSSASAFTPAPLYERFAKTGNTSTSAANGTVPARRTAPHAQLRSTDGREGSARRSEVRQEPVVRTRVGTSGGPSSRTEERAGEDVRITSREDKTRAVQSQLHHQLSPPVPLDFPKANGTPNTNRRLMPNVNAYALDDLPPPTHLLNKTRRTIQKQENKNAPRLDKTIHTEDAKLSRMLTPPSPPSPPTLPLADTPARTTTSKFSPDTPRGSAPAPATPPSSFASPSSSATVVDESGALAGSNALKGSPNLGNSLEAHRGPRKGKYSLLAAFGPSISTSSSAASSSSPSLSPVQDTPPPPPPKPLSPAASPTVPSFKIDSTQLPNASLDRPSFDSLFYSEQHASVQPLKTASVELRVGLCADELETFHSPLFGAGFGARSSEEGDQHDGMDSAGPPKRRAQPGADPSNIWPKDASAVMPASVRASFHDNDERLASNRLNEIGRGRNGRMKTLNAQPIPANLETLPRPPLPPVPDASRDFEHGENGSMRERSESVLSAGSSRKKAIVYGNYSEDDVPSMPNVQQDQPQTPRPIIKNQMPTPPTSVDGHGYEQSNQRLTIASVLDGEYSPDVPSPASLESRRIGKTTSSRRTVPDPSSSSLASSSADAAMNGRARWAGESHADTSANEMTARKAVAPSMSVSSSSSSADVLLGNEVQVQLRPTPKVHSQNLPSQAHAYFPLSNGEGPQQHLAPLSPPQSPPQPVASVLSSAQSRTRARSKSRTRSSNRPGTASSAHSQDYVPPSSASSTDGPNRSPSALSIFHTFSSSSSVSGKHIPRKLVKTPPHPTRSMTDSSSVVEQDRNQRQRQITESPEPVDSLLDADPFAKDEIVRAPTSELMTPPVPPFVQGYASGSSSGPPSPASPGDYFSSRTRRRGERLDAKPREAAQALVGTSEGLEGEETPRPLASESAMGGDEQVEPGPEPEPELEPEPVEPTFYPLEKHLMHADLLELLLPHLTFRDWCALIATNDALRRTVEHRRELREVVLEHFLRTVGYARWKWSTKEHVMLTFRDLNSYMRGVSIPSHQYAVYAKAWLDAKEQVQRQPGDEYLKFNLKTATAQKSLLASSCRAYTRVVLRLRTQAEAMERDAEGDAAVYQFTPPQSTTSVNTRSYGHGRIPSHGNRSVSRVRASTPSRPASPTTSSVSHSYHGHSANGNGLAKVNRYERAALAGLGPRFRSPLFRLGHAPCLRVCVPSAEGVWLSDASVLECEKEMKRAGVVPLLRVGDVVWNTAVGDEGNDGRMIWDGNYLIDLDYTYSRTGEVPQYLHTLSFPPSYFHRVIRTASNPICHIDISPWGEEIAANLQLLQDRIKTETPQGGHHTVVRWIHRSKFRVRPNPYTKASIPIPNTSLSVDPGWYGSVIIEFEGTNEGLADMQQRCRSGFPPRAVGGDNGELLKTKQPSKAFRLLRERSRPGEIWLRAIPDKERLL